jgi:hypothetical protein
LLLSKTVRPIYYIIICFKFSYVKLFLEYDNYNDLKMVRPERLKGDVPPVGVRKTIKAAKGRFISSEVVEGVERGLM